MSAIVTELTQDQIDFFQREGYLALEALTTQEEVAWLRQIYDRLFSQRAGREEGNQFDLAGTDEENQEATLPQILDPAKYAPELNDSQLLRNVTRLGKQLLGEEATCSFVHAIFKPARTGAATPWHQDAAYSNPNLIPRKINFWVPLQEATLGNGCMQFIPGSHRLRPQVLRHQTLGNDPRVHGLELHPGEMGRVTGAVACPLPPGGATLHGSYMLHYTAPNRSDTPRRALIAHAALPPETLPEPRRFPWQETRHTARDDRVKAARSAAQTM